MKTILIPTEDHDGMSAALEAALLVARAFDGYMEGFAVRPLAASYVTVEPVSGLAIADVDQEEVTRAACEQFEAFMKAHDVPQGPPACPMAGRAARRPMTVSSAAMAVASI